MKMTKLIPTALFLFCAGACGILCAQAPPAGQADAPQAPLPNYLELSPRIGTGGQPTEQGLRELAAKGYKSIINVRTAAEKADLAAEENVARQLGLKYFQVPLAGKEPNEPQVEAFLQIMKALQDEKIFVHCAAASRVGALMMVHLALQEGTPVNQAEETARRIGMRPGPLVDFAKKMIEKKANR